MKKLVTAETFKNYPQEVPRNMKQLRTSNGDTGKYLQKGLQKMITSVASLRQHIVKRCQRAELKNKKRGTLRCVTRSGLSSVVKHTKGAQSMKE